MDVVQSATFVTVAKLIITLFILQSLCIQGTSFRPIAYTLPDGLTRINGSNSTGGCQPVECLIVPIPFTTINGCDCPGDAPASGVLIDGDIPSIDTTQRAETWASGLFVVNTTGRTSFRIAFQFNHLFYLRHVSIAYFDCGIWNTGFSSVSVNTSQVFPLFLAAAVENIGTLTLDDVSQDCISLRTISVQTQPTAAFNQYFVEFFFPSDSSLHWVHLGEISFSDTTAPPTAGSDSTTTVEMPSTTMVGSETTMITTVTSSSTSVGATEDVTPTNISFTSDTPTEATTTDGEVTNSTPAPVDAVPITTIVGALVGVIVLLIMLIALGGVFVSCFVFYNKRHIKRLEVRQLQYIVTENPEHEMSKTSTAEFPNSQYQRSSRFLHGYLNLPRISTSPEQDVYSEVRDVGGKGRTRCELSDTNSGLYDDIEHNNYSVIPNLYAKADSPTHQAPDVEEVKHDVMADLDVNGEAPPKKKPDYTLIQKQPAPPIPNKSCELKKYLDLKVKDEDGENQQHEESEHLGEVNQDEDYYSKVKEAKEQHDNKRKVSVDNNHYARGASNQLKVPTIELEPVGIYSEVGQELGESETDFYTDMDGKKTPLLSPCRSNRSSCGSGPVLLSKPLFDAMEDNPTYDTSGSLLHAFINHGEDIYTDPDERFRCDSHQAIYEAIYSDSSVQPSLFKRQKNDEGIIPVGRSKKGEDQDERGEEDEEDQLVVYAPIYTLEDSLPLVKREPLKVNNDNIRGVKVLGTGFFGKVVLADTVGLSLKDLNFSDDDDNKSVSVRVAVKKLKPNASETTKEAFEKECKFMSRLSHPNVIRLLGVCTTAPSQFIMMEYMERGDLNNYLLKFEKIIKEGVPNEKEILVGTLVYMCTQIASAMNYLVTRNFIHRDLAARNCLVGADYLIKLADFGMSRSLYESHYYVIKGQAVLPVRWMATECFYGKFSAKTDVWSFGVTMWEILMLAKERPYAEMEDLELVNDAIENENRTLLQQPAHCPDEVYELMMKCWASDPQDRATFYYLHTALSQLSINHVDNSAI